MLDNKLVFKDKNIDIKIVRGVYFLFLNNEIVYIGQSEDIFKRVSNHLSNKNFTSWNYIEYCDTSLDEIEAMYILTHKPKLNKSIPTNNIWISQGMCKDKFGIGRVESNKRIISKEFECIIFNGIKYIKGLV